MKFKKVLFIVLLTLFFSVPCFGGSEYSRVVGDGELTSSDNGAIKTGAGALTAIEVYADGTNEATVTLYDSITAASGTLLTKQIVKAGDKFGGRPFSKLKFKTGLYLTVTGTGAACHVEIEER
jgi:hypothetical protein